MVDILLRTSYTFCYQLKLRKLLVNLMMVVLVAGLLLTACQDTGKKQAEQGASSIVAQAEQMVSIEELQTEIAERRRAEEVIRGD